MGTRGPQRSEGRNRFEADLPKLEQRLRTERVTFLQLSREYGLSVPALKNVVAAAGFTKRLADARRAYREAAARKKREEKGVHRRRRQEIKDKRIARLKEALSHGGTLTGVAHELGLHKGHLSRLAKEAGLSPPRGKRRKTPSDQNG